MAKQVTTYAGNLSHFASHLLPIYQALPDEVRGPFHARGRSAAYAQEHGVQVTGGVPRRAELVMVASFEDHRAVNPSPTILVNHGVGMRYSGESDNPSYSGGKNRERVILHLCPSEHDAEACRAGGSKAVAVGPAKLTSWHDGSKKQRVGEKPVVAFSFHADVHVCPETRWAFPEYQQAITDLAAQRDSLPFDIIGHAHPRMYGFMTNFWKKLKVEFVPDFDDVLDRASVFVADNTSCLFEFASTGRPVVVLNASYYRRDVQHNLRFWSHVPGIQVDRPDNLLPTILLALEDHYDARQMREDAVAYAYTGPQGLSLCDGKAVERAVSAIMELLDAG